MNKERWITDKDDIEYILSLDEKALKLSTIIELFGEFDGKRRFNPSDYIKIPANTYGKNKEFVTTVGLWVYNRLFIEKDFYDTLGYINEPISDDKYSELNKRLSYMYMEDKIDREKFKRYLMKYQIIMSICSVLSSNDTELSSTLSEKINKKKIELIKENKEELLKGNEIVAEKIEKELLSYAKDIIKNDDYADIYDSGARGSYKNNFKNTYVMKGAIMNPITNKFDIATFNYMDGVNKEEFYILANSLANGPYSRANRTSIGGYWEKLFLYAMHHIVLGPVGSDCGTKRYITVELNKSNISEWMYSYIVENGKLIELNSDNMDKYINKTVKMRFSSLCESKDYICNKCAGEMFNKLGFKNIGMLTANMASILKNKSMKAFHDGTVSTHEIDINKMFSIK